MPTPEPRALTRVTDAITEGLEDELVDDLEIEDVLVGLVEEAQEMIDRVESGPRYDAEDLEDLAWSLAYDAGRALLLSTRRHAEERGE